MVRIPIDTKFNYFASEDGKIFRGDDCVKTRLNGWEHRHIKNGKMYRRHRIVMANGTVRQLYEQRLVACAYHGMPIDSGLLVRHLTPNSLDNHKDRILPGTHEDNNTVDRIIAGTYFNRGAGNSVEEIGKEAPCPF